MKGTNCMNKFKRNKIVLIQIIVFWIIVTALVIASNFFVQESMKAYFLKQRQEISIQIGKNVEDTLNEKFKILRITAKYIDEKDLSNLKETAESFSETIEKEGFRKMAISTLDGKSYASNGEIYDV